MKTTLVWMFAAILAGSGTMMRFYQNHEDLPKGCDEFGYLHQANAMAEHRTFENHVDRPWLGGLLDTLRSSGITEQELSWMVAPHAYHVIPGSKQIINQYPPGTAFLLHFIPIEWRRILFPFLAMVILIALYAAARADKKTYTLQDLLFTGMLFMFFFSPPFVTELARVNSVAFTWGLLLAAGMFLEKRVLIAAFLIGLTVNFRTANILMLVPLAVLMIPKGSGWPGINNSLRLAIISIVTISPLLLYNYLLTGNAFTTTYSAIDTAFAGWSQIKSNFIYYIDWDQRWFRLHLVIVLICVTLMVLRKAEWNEFAGILLFPLLNYLFFMFHAVQMDYYPYASSIILTGWAIGQFGKIPFGEKMRYFTPAITIMSTLVFLMVGHEKYSVRPKYTFDEMKQSYYPLCEYDIVWADMLSGTTEYACGNSGLRYFTSTPRARKIAAQYLSENGYRQVILLDDTPVETVVITGELAAAGLVYTFSQDKRFKRMLTID